MGTKLNFLLLFLMPFILMAQGVDTFAVEKQVDSLLQVSRTFFSQDDYEKALEVIALADQLVLDSLGKESAAYGNVCYLHGRILDFKGKFDGAEKWYRESLTIREKVLGKDHPDYAQSLNGLGELYAIMGQFEKSEPLHLQATAILENTFGKNHLEYASSLNSLGMLYLDIAQYEKAEQIYLESKSIIEKILDKHCREYTRILNNLAIVYSEIGNYEMAEHLLLENKKIWENDLKNTQHKSYFNCLNNLANVYLRMGRYEEAERLHLKVFSGLTELGEEETVIMDGLVNLSNIYSITKRYEEAEETYKKVLTVYAKTIGKSHKDYSIPLQNLANVYSETGRYKESESMLLETLEIRGNTWGKKHHFYAETLNFLGFHYMQTQRKADAEQLFLEASKIREESQGNEHPEYMKSLFNLGNYYSELNDQRASAYFQEGVNLLPIIFNRAAKHSSERDLLALSNKYFHIFQDFYSFLQTHKENNELKNSAYNLTLFFKGFLLEGQLNLQKYLVDADSLNLENYHQWIGCHRLLAIEYTKPVDQRIGVEELEEKANHIEKELTRTIAGFSDIHRLITWQEVQSKLQPGEAAIEFVHYKFRNPKMTDSMMYAALLILPEEQPQFIPLFEEKSLDSLFQTQGQRKADYVNNLYSVAERGAKPIGKPQKSLYEILWQPLEKELTDVQTIYFSPTGLLHRLNLGAIPTSIGNNDEETLADRYSLKQLGSTRQIVIPSIVENYEQDALLYGGIQYEVDSFSIELENKAYDSEMMASRGDLVDSEINFNITDNALRGGSWTYLKWTEKEVTSLEGILEANGIRTTTHRNYDATEESFKAIGRKSTSPRILHLATHGFFFPDPVDTVKNSQLTAFNKESVIKLSDYPMIRSGLILAGGNYAWKTGKTFRQGMEDGILTAYEISQMNLSNTELVVLSACETGLGDIEGNEGVYGLQRAFKIAGVNYIIMSLWQVPDRETKDFMITFYKHWLENEMTIPDAFRKTQQEMKERFYNPYQWAGFVLLE